MSRLVRGSAIAIGGAVIAGFGLGFAAGNEPDQTELPAARLLPSDLCARLGDIGTLMPAKAELQQSGSNEVRCRAEVAEKSQATYTFAKLFVTATTYPPKIARTADDEARKALDNRPGEPVANRAYPTKVSRNHRGDESWLITIVTQRADTLVQVEYEASPVDRTKAEQALLLLADRAIWESK